MLNLSTILFIFNFYPQEGKEIVFFSYFISSLISFLYNGKNILNPYRNIKALDYNLLLTTIPLFSSGFVLGDLITWNEKLIYLLSSVIFISILILLYFGRFCIRFYFIFHHSKENDVIEPDLIINQKDNKRETSSESEIDKREMQIEQVIVEKELMNEKEIIQKEKLRPLFIFFLIFLLFSSMVNNKYIKKYSIPSNIITTIFIIFCIIYTYFINKKVYSNYQKIKSLNYPYTTKDLRYSSNFILKLSIIGLLSGLACGSTGIDPGTILTLFLILNNAHLHIIYASMNAFVLLCSFFGLIYYFFQGKVLLNYIVLIIISTMIGSFIGNKILNHFIILKYNNNFAYFAILSCMLLSLFVYPICSFIFLF